MRVHAAARMRLPRAFQSLSSHPQRSWRQIWTYTSDFWRCRRVSRAPSRRTSIPGAGGVGGRSGSVPEPCFTTPGGSFTAGDGEARSCPLLTDRPFISSIVQEEKKQPIRAALMCLLCIRDGRKKIRTEQSGGFMWRNTSKCTRAPELPQISIGFQALPLKITRTRRLIGSPLISICLKNRPLIKHDVLWILQHQQQSDEHSKGK